MSDIKVKTTTYTNGIIDRPIYTPAIYTNTSDVINYLQTVGIIDINQQLLENVITFSAVEGTQIVGRMIAEFNQPTYNTPTIRIRITGVTEDVTQILETIGFNTRIDN